MRFSRDLGGGHLTLVETLSRLEDQVTHAKHKRINYWRSLLNDEVEISVEGSKESYREILRLLPLLNACAHLLFPPNVSFQLVLWDAAYDNLIAGGCCHEEDGHERLQTLVDHYDEATFVDDEDEDE